VRQAKEDARPVHNHSSSFPLTTLMATKDLRVHPLINPAASFFLLLCIVIVKIIVEILASMFMNHSNCSNRSDLEILNCPFLFPFVWHNMWQFFSLVQKSNHVATSSGFHLFGGIGGWSLVFVQLCIVVMEL